MFEILGPDGVPEVSATPRKWGNLRREPSRQPAASMLARSSNGQRCSCDICRSLSEPWGRHLRDWWSSSHGVVDHDTWNILKLACASFEPGTPKAKAKAKATTDVESEKKKALQSFQHLPSPCFLSLTLRDLATCCLVAPRSGRLSQGWVLNLQSCLYHFFPRGLQWSRGYTEVQALCTACSHQNYTSRQSELNIISVSYDIIYTSWICTVICTLCICKMAHAFHFTGFTFLRKSWNFTRGCHTKCWANDSRWVYVFKHRDEGDKEAPQIIKWGLDSNPNIMEWE